MKSTIIQKFKAYLRGFLTSNKQVIYSKRKRPAKNNSASPNCLPNLVLIDVLLIIELGNETSGQPLMTAHQIEENIGLIDN